MKTLVTALVIVAIATTAFAGKTGKPMGPMDLMVYADGTAALINNGATPFLFDGYTLVSTAGLLPNAMGIFDNALADMVTFPAKLGMTVPEALGWTEMSATATNYSEVTMGKGATLAAGDTIMLGAGFDGYNQDDGIFTYVDSTLPDGQTSFEGRIIPEPTTMSLLGLGVLALIRRRR
jgi:hypothetical protein